MGIIEEGKTERDGLRLPLEPNDKLWVGIQGTDAR
jgi:hypothetical protein